MSPADITPRRFGQAVVFTGHMIDAPGRSSERFPARAESAAKLAIERSMRTIVAAQDADGSLVGIAGGASGGDILFHEVCATLGVPTLLRLALPVPEYIEASVAPAGVDWVARFHQLVKRLGPESVKVLDDTIILPASLTEGAALNIWQRTNLWMVGEAIDLAAKRTLLALWDGRPGDGPGGTEHLVAIAPRLGIDVAPVIRTQSLGVELD